MERAPLPKPAVERSCEQPTDEECPLRRCLSRPLTVSGVPSTVRGDPRQRSRQAPCGDVLRQPPNCHVSSTHSNSGCRWFDVMPDGSLLRRAWPIANESWSRSNHASGAEKGGLAMAPVEWEAVSQDPGELAMWHQIRTLHAALDQREELSRMGSNVHCRQPAATRTEK